MPGLEFETQVGVLPLIRDPPGLRENPQPKKIKRRDAELDPLILAVALASGPHITRNHHAHNFLHAVGDPRTEGTWDWTKSTAEAASPTKQDPKRRFYQSRQAPRKQRLRVSGLPADPEPQVEIVTSPTELKSPSLQTQANPPRLSVGDGSVQNERACYVYPINRGASSQRPAAIV